MANVAIIGLQWGDEGKGKIVDFLADQFDAVVRFQGGHNAGHTIKVGDKTYKLNLLPSGVIRDKFSVIGSGVVIDPIALFNEIEKIAVLGISITPEKLNIADNCCLILSVHSEIDQLLEAQKGSKKIGTTGRGIGPAYEDKTGRRAIRICDLFNEKVLRERLEALLFYHNLLRKSLNVAEVSVVELLAELAPIKEKIAPFIKPSYEILQKLSACKNVMFEGAQGALLDVNFGTYPFVTSSNTLAGQVALGSCMGADALTKTLGVLKAYTTRVGSGPFPTELEDETGEFLRIEGGEVGTVTGRNRRCGWFDAALVRHVIKLSASKEIALTKLDVLDKLPKIKICVAYKIDGKRYEYLPQSIDLCEKIEPIYEEFDGWMQSTSTAKAIADLPINAQKYLKKIEELCEVKIAILSNGPKRDETIIVSKII
ncbi:MAG: adenylosuccinate synthase [Rickettsiales bacterium]|nr:adenylosuccinate synthase [Rickettsiales bacterium]